MQLLITNAQPARHWGVTQRQTFLYETPSGITCDFLKGILNLIGVMAAQKGSFNAHLQIPAHIAS